jgi:hypothetical protein
MLVAEELMEINASALDNQNDGEAYGYSMYNDASKLHVDRPLWPSTTNGAAY